LHAKLSIISRPPTAPALASSFANKIFVNREGRLRIFGNAAFDIPADSARRLTFDGIGGRARRRSARGCMQHSKPKADPDLLLNWIRHGLADAGVAAVLRSF